MAMNRTRDLNSRMPLWCVFLGGLLLLALTFPLAAGADEVFVSNKPFTGRMYGLGDDIRFSIKDLADSLEVRAVQTPEGWFLHGVAVPTVEQQGVVWVNLADLPEKIVRVVRNREFKSLDIYRSKEAGVAGQSRDWGGDGTLVFFGASWCPTCKAMKPTMAQFEQSRRIRVAYVDVEESASAAFKDFAFLFEGDKIPYFVILDGSGRKVDSFFGFQTYSELLTRVEKHLK